MTPPDPNTYPINSAIIIGGGVCGITLALSLQKVSIPFTIHEARPTQSTIGGAVNLTPSALRYLSSISVLPKILQLGYPVKSIDIFSIYTGQKHASLTFPPIDGLEHGALRIMRKDLLSALLDTLAEKGKEQVQYGKKLTSIREHEPKDDGVTAVFEDGTTATADIIIGCDGIHSLTRTTYVDAERKSVYTGLSAAYGLLPTSSIKAPIHFADTSVNSARSGTLMASYCDKSKSTMYFTALMQIPDQADREGWRVRGADQEKLRAEVQERFRKGRVQCLKEMAEKIGELYLYPVNKLEDGDKWFRGRVLLLGDAAHAMPPQGESTGFAIEDAILFAHIISKAGSKKSQNEDIQASVQKSDDPTPVFATPTSIVDLFTTYTNLRQPIMSRAFKQAEWRWETGKESGWFAFRMKLFITPWWLWWTQKQREEEWTKDVRDLVV